MTKQVWFITGPKGSGKSTAACRIARPSEISRMAVFDTEDSMSNIIQQNERNGVAFGAYIRAYDRFQMDNEMLTRISKGALPWVDPKQRSTLASYWEWFVSQLNEHIKPGQFDYLVIDTIEPVEAACVAWCESNKKQSGWTTTAYGRSETEAVRPLLQGMLEGVHKRGVNDILVTSHIKNPWVEYAPGKSRPVMDRLKPGGRLKVWSTISTAMFWMMRPAYPINSTGAPSAIVLKARRDKTDVTDSDDWIIQSTIPQRIPAFNWSTWRQYESGEIVYDPLRPQEGETLLPDEKRMLEELMSAEEYRLMILGAEIALQGDNEKSEPLIVNQASAFKPPSNGNEIQALAAKGLQPEQIAQQLGKPLPVVKAVLGV